MYLERYPLLNNICEFNLSAKIKIPAPASEVSEVPICVSNDFRRSRQDVTKQLGFSASSIRIFGWPSRGGVTIFEGAGIPDVDFSLDRLHPLEKRCDDPNDKGAFCQNVLLLGAKWFGSYNRYTFLLLVEELDVGELEHSLEPGPTISERGDCCLA